jgi:hypothetical protein
VTVFEVAVVAQVRLVLAVSGPACLTQQIVGLRLQFACLARQLVELRV